MFQVLFVCDSCECGVNFLHSFLLLFVALFLLVNSKSDDLDLDFQWLENLYVRALWNHLIDSTIGCLQKNSFAFLIQFTHIHVHSKMGNSIPRSKFIIHHFHSLCSIVCSFSPSSSFLIHSVINLVIWYNCDDTQYLNYEILWLNFLFVQRITPISRANARPAIRRTAIGSQILNAPNNNMGVNGSVTLQTQIGAISQNGKYQLQIIAQPEQQHRAR